MNIGTKMGIVADNETAVKNAVMDITLSPLANLANLMGWGWAGGCNSWVGGGMDRTDNGWQAHFDGCGGYMSDVRLGIDYADWSFNLVNIIWGTPTQAELTPTQIDGGLLDNWESGSPLNSTYAIKLAKTSTVTDTKTSTFNFQSETSFSVEYKPPSATGGVGGSFTQKLVFGQNNATGHTDTTTNSVESTFTFAKMVPAYARAKWSAIMSRTLSSATYTAIIVPKFSVQLKGFLKWGGDDPNGPNTNYHKDYAGKGSRPRTDGQGWAKFGGAGVSFADDLSNKVKNRILPWQWQRLLNQHPEAQSYINQLTNSANYAFTITGRVDNVEGTRVDPHYDAEQYNPAHPQAMTSALAISAMRPSARAEAVPEPQLLTATAEV
jgi:hypothetical protein